jgi:putative hemolysin
MAISLLLIPMAATLLVSAIFSASETAAFQLSRNDLAKLRAPERIRRALEWILDHRRPILVTVLLANVVVNLFYMNLGQALAEELGDRFGRGYEVVAGVFVLLTLVLFGDVIPKTIALHRPALVARITALPLQWSERVLRVPRVALTAITDALMRLFKLSGVEGDVTPDELQEVLKLAAQKGQLGMDEQEWLRALLELDRVQVKEVIVPRIEMTTFDLREGRAAFLDLFVRTRRNKIPVHDGNVDKIRGYLAGKDVLSWPDRALEALIRPIIFIPESASIAAAMQQMQTGGRRLAVVVDEYGGTEGLVTQEDLVESVVGDLYDESEARWEPVKEIEPGVFLVDAALPLHELRRVFGAGPVRRGIATVGGLVAATLERVPKKGDAIAFGNVRIEVALMRGRRPDRVLLRYDRRRLEARP